MCAFWSCADTGNVFYFICYDLYSRGINGQSSLLKRESEHIFRVGAKIHNSDTDCCFSSLRGEDHLHTTGKSLNGCNDPTFMWKYRPCLPYSCPFSIWKQAKVTIIQMSVVTACRLVFWALGKEDRNEEETDDQASVFNQSWWQSLWPLELQVWVWKSVLLTGQQDWILKSQWWKGSEPTAFSHLLSLRSHSAWCETEKRQWVKE